MNNTLDMKVEINAEQVQQQIVKAIMESAIGENLNVEINRLLTKSNTWTDNIIQTAIKRVMEDVMTKEIMKNLEGRREEIKLLVANRLTDEMISRTLDKLINHSLNY